MAASVCLIFSVLLFGGTIKFVSCLTLCSRTLKIRQTDAAIAYILDQIPDFTGDILKQFFSHLEPPKSNAMVAAFSLYKPITNSVRYIGHF